jgi:hypothetical protein
MVFTEIIREPSARDRKALALSLGALGVMLALLIWFRPGSLLVIACVSAVAWCVSILFSSDEPRSRQLKSAVVPLAFALLYALAVSFKSPALVAIAAAAALVALGVIVWLRENFGRSFYTTWMHLFLPIAWSVSTLLLVVIYYGVITPFGLAMRLVGRDPMQRKFDRDRATYWVKRSDVAGPERYFRQF